MDFEARSTGNDDYDTPKKRVAAWNAYREANPDFVPDLTNSDLSRAVLCGINLRRAELQDATLASANLEDAQFTFGNLTNAIFIDAELKNADFRCAQLEHADFRSANLENATFLFANLHNALLNSADLVCADFRETRLENAKLVGARFRNTKLGGAQLENANLMDAEGFRFDSTFIRDCATSRDAEEPWLVLRRSYTGPRLLFILFLLSLFLLPYAAKTLWWVGVNKGQVVSRDALAERQAELKSRDQAELSVEEARELGAIEEVAAYLAEVDETWIEWQTWQLVLGVDKGWFYWITAVLILTYNTLRIYLTWEVSALRHEEELGGPSPAYRAKWLSGRAIRATGWKGHVGDFQDWLGRYRHSVVWLYGCHRVAWNLMFVAVASGAIHLLDWLTRPVLLPPG